MLTFPKKLLRLGLFVQTNSTVSNVASTDISTVSYCIVSRRKTNYNFYAISSSFESESFKSYHLSEKKKDIFCNAFYHFPDQTVENWKQRGKGSAFSIACLMNEF